MERTANLRSYGHVLFMVCTFVSSRIYAFAHGVHFDAATWPEFWHFVDRAPVERELAKTLWHMHSQPPLLNGFVGSFHNLFGVHTPALFSLLFVAMGAWLVREVYVLARNAELSPWLSALLASAMAAAPSTLLFENFLFYTYPESLLLLLACNLSIACLRMPSLVRFALLASVACLLVLLRSLFHPLWAVLMLGFVLLSLPKPQRIRFARACVVPIGLVLLFCVKNLALYQTTSLSSWRGMNLARVVIDTMPKELRKQWVDEGYLSPVAGVGGFKPLDRYRPFIPTPSTTGVLMLDAPTKASGAPNFHHLSYVQISRQLERDALRVMRRQPALYLRAVGKNLLTSFEPAWQYRALKPATQKIASYADGWFLLFGLGGKTPRSSIAWMVITALAIAFGFGAWRRTRLTRQLSAATALLCACMALYVIGVGALLERSENQRFRYDVDPMIGVLLLLMVRELARRMKSRAHRAGPN